MFDDMMFIVEEAARINAKPVEGDQAELVKLDMECWSIRNGMFDTATYNEIVKAHADDRGWSQEGVNGLEIV